MVAIIKLLRVEQYYKNLIIGVAVVFSGTLLDTTQYAPLLLGFIALCLISSVNYIINDIIDRDADKKNKEKAQRPIASKAVSIPVAVAIAIVLALLSLMIAYSLSYLFTLIVIAIALLTTIYTLIAKKEPFADIIVLSLNFVLRAVAGAVIISVWISPWLLIGMFFLAFFLASAKRYSELLYLGKSAKSHRSVLSHYSIESLGSLLSTASAVLIVTFALYSVLTKNESLLITFPIALYLLLRFLLLTKQGSIIARAPHLAIKDRRLSIGFFLFVLCTITLLY